MQVYSGKGREKLGSDWVMIILLSKSEREPKAHFMGSDYPAVYVYERNEVIENISFKP